MDMVRLLVSIHWTLLFFTSSSDQEFQGNRTKQEGEKTGAGRLAIDGAPELVLRDVLGSRETCLQKSCKFEELS